MRLFALLLVLAAAGVVAAGCPAYPPTRGYAVKVEPVVLAFFQFLPAAVPVSPSQQLAPAPPPPAADGPPVAVYGEATSGAAIRLLTRHCAVCHTQGAARAGVTLFDGFGNFRSKGIGGKAIAEVLRTDRMPLGARHDPSKRLSSQDKSVILNFLEGERP